jgi:hypothetical protein
MSAKLAFTAISEIPLFGSRAAAINCCREAATNALEAVPKAFCRRCHHSRHSDGQDIVRNQHRHLDGRVRRRMGSVGQPSPCCPGGLGPGRYVRNDDQREVDAVGALCRLFVRFLSGPYPLVLSPGHAGLFLGRLGARRNAEALREFKQHVMGAQKTPVAEQSQKSALARAWKKSREVQRRYDVA